MKTPSGEADEDDGIITDKSKPMETNLCFHLLKWDYAKRKPCTGNRYARFDEEAEVGRPLLYSTHSNTIYFRTPISDLNVLYQQDIPDFQENR